jgi:pimeloyl-ACP methyl ester carboxylesterase
MAPPLPTSDPEPQAWDRPSGRLTFVDEGPKDGLVFFTLHGVPGSVRDFRYLAAPLCSRIRLVRLDLPGFGGSAPEESALRSFGGRAQAVLDLADHLGAPRFGLIGHSMGGGAAMVLAARERGRVSHLVLLASIGLRTHRGIAPGPRAFRTISWLMARPGLGKLMLPLARDAYRRRRFPGVDAMRPADFARHFQAIGAADFAELGRAVARGLPPSLVAWSRDDHMLEPEIPEELMARIPGARPLVFDEAGHNLQKTRAVEVAQAIFALVGLSPADRTR